MKCLSKKNYHGIFIAFSLQKIHGYFIACSSYFHKVCYVWSSFQGLLPPADSKSGHYMQQCLACPAVLPDSISHYTTASSASLTDGVHSPSTCVGQLFLRLARLPPGSQDLNHHPKPDVSTVHTGECSRTSHIQTLWGAPSVRICDCCVKQWTQNRISHSEKGVGIISHSKKRIHFYFLFFS